MFQNFPGSYFINVFQENKPVYTDKDWVSPKVIL